MIVVEVLVFLVMCFDVWSSHNSRFKFLRDPPRTFLREKKKQKKIKEKPTPQAGMAGKARRNGINGLSAGMWVYAVVPCFDYVCMDVRPAYLC